MPRHAAIFFLCATLITPLRALRRFTMIATPALRHTIFAARCLRACHFAAAYACRAAVDVYHADA